LSKILSFWKLLSRFFSFKEEENSNNQNGIWEKLVRHWIKTVEVLFSEEFPGNY